MATQTKTAVIWIAVSSSEQATDSSTGEEKESLRAQLGACETWCAQNGYTVLEVLNWDGYSRWESNPIRALEDFARAGRLEYHRLCELWERRAFDVLVCHNHSRLGRSFTMQAWVIENIIRSGAEIYRMQGGWIRANDYAGQLALGGFSTITEISRFVELGLISKRKRVERGLLATGATQIHKIVYDTITGKAIGAALRDEYAPMWSAVGDMILSGTALYELDAAVSAQGWRTLTGKPFTRGRIQNLVLSPPFWGHGYLRKGDGVNSGHWAYDLSVAPPDDVTMIPDVYPPVYTGTRADDIKEELSRRSFVVRGRGRPEHTQAFTGLCVCMGCGNTMSVNKRFVFCARTFPSHGRACSNHGSVDEKYIRAWINEHIRTWIDAGNMDGALESALGIKHDGYSAASVEREGQQRRVDTLMDELINADASVRSMIRERLVREKTKLDTIEERLRSMHYQQITQDGRAQSAGLLLTAMRPDADTALRVLWARSPREINQFLFALLGELCIEIDGPNRTPTRFIQRVRSRRILRST